MYLFKILLSSFLFIFFISLESSYGCDDDLFTKGGSKRNISEDYGSSKKVKKECLTQIELSEKEDMIDLVRPLLTGDKNVDDHENARAELVEVVAALKQEEREEVINSVQKLLYEGEEVEKDLYSRVELVTAVAKISPGKREEMVNTLMQIPMFNDSTSAYYQAEFVEAVAQIEPSQVKIVIDAAEKVMPDEWNDISDQAKVIGAVAEIESDQRSEVIDLMQQLFFEGDEGINRGELIRSITEIKPCQRQDFINKAMPILPNVGECDLHKVIRQLCTDEPGPEKGTVLQKI